MQVFPQAGNQDTNEDSSILLDRYHLRILSVLDPKLRMQVVMRWFPKAGNHKTTNFHPLGTISSVLASLVLKPKTKEAP